MKIIYYFSLILWLTGCSWITSSNTKIVISLGEERALKKSINLPFGYLELLVLRLTSLDGSTIYKEKFFQYLVKLIVLRLMIWRRATFTAQPQFIKIIPLLSTWILGSSSYRAFHKLFLYTLVIHLKKLSFELSIQIH